MSTKYIASNWRLPNQENSSKNDNYGLTFDGSSERIEIPFTQLNGATNCTISFWAKINYSVDSEPKYPFTLTSGTDYDIMWNFGANGTSLDVYIGNLNFRLDGSFNNDIDEWNHWVLRFDGSQSSGDRTKIYQNGQQLTSQAGWGTATSIPTASHLIIGGRNLGSTAWYYQFPGSISDISIFDYTLSESQISTLYGSSSLGSGNPMILNPVAYYPLGDNSSSNPLTQPNVAVEDATVFDFDGSNDYITCGNTLGSGYSSISVSSWVNFDNPNVALREEIISKDDGSNRSFALFKNKNSDWAAYGTVGLLVNDGTTTSNATASQADFTPVADTWYHVLGTWDGVNIKLYINGELKKTTAFSASNLDTNTVNVLIGDSSISGSYFMNGQISNVAIWNSDQSSEVSNIYNSGVPATTYTNTPKAWYKLNNTANWEADSSGNWQIPEATSSYPQSFDFVDGNSTRITSNFNLPTSTTNFSFSAWINPNSTTAAGVFIANNDSGTDGYNAFISLNNIYFRINGNDVTGSISGLANTWIHVVGTYDGTTQKLYINNSSPSTNSVSTSVSVNDVTLIGAREDLAGAWFDGQISNVQIWTTTLSATGTDSVETLYNNGSPLTTAIASSNLKAWYKLDNSATFSTNWVVENSAITPNFNKAIDFVSSSTQYIDLTNTGFPTGNAARTISAWIKSDSTGQNNEQGILRYGTTATRQLFMMSLAASSGQLRVATYADDFTYSTADLRDDAWHHVALTYDGTSIKGYVDGSYVGVETNTLVNTTANSPAIGNWNGGGFTFNGAISNVLLYTETLTDANILTLYNNGTPQTTPYGSPFGWWKLNDLATGIQDSGSGGNNGTLVNSPLLISTDVKAGSGISSGMTEQNLVNNNVSALNGESSGMTSANLVTSDLTRAIPYGDGYSFNFDSASSDYIEISQSSTLEPANVSVSVWFKGAAQATNNTYLVSKVANTGSKGYALYTGGSTDKLVFFIWNGSTWIVTPLAGVVMDDNWHQAVATFDGTNLKLYVDGSLYASNTSASGITYNAGELIIGAQKTTPSYLAFDGQLSNCAIFNEALTSTEVLKLYANGVPQDLSSFTPQPVAWYPLGSNSFWNGSAWTCRDMIGSNDGTSANIGADGLVGDAPRSEANGTGTNMDVPSNLEGNTKWSSNNSYSVNMSSEARKQDTP